MSKFATDPGNIHLSFINEFKDNPALNLIRVIAYIKASYISYLENSVGSPVMVEEYVEREFSGFAEYIINNQEVVLDFSKILNGAFDEATCRNLVIVDIQNNDIKFLTKKTLDQERAIFDASDPSDGGDKVLIQALTSRKNIYEKMKGQLELFSKYIANNLSPLSIAIYLNQNQVAKEIIEQTKVPYDFIQKEKIPLTTIALFTNPSLFTYLINKGCKLDESGLVAMAIYNREYLIKKFGEIIEEFNSEKISREYMDDIVLKFSTVISETEGKEYTMEEAKDQFTIVFGDDFAKPLIEEMNRVVEEAEIFDHEDNRAGGAEGYAPELERGAAGAAAGGPEEAEVIVSQIAVDEAYARLLEVSQNPEEDVIDLGGEVQD